MDEVVYHIRISSLLVSLHTRIRNVALVLPEAFRNFIFQGAEKADLDIEVKELIEDCELDKHLSVASYVASDHSLVPPNMRPPSYLWEVRIENAGYRIATWSQQNNSYLPVEIRFTPGMRSIEVSSTLVNKELFPFGFPSGSLLVYLVSALVPAMLIHASAVDYEGRGYLFTGRSGVGKSTMAKLWQSQNASIIHDDRIMVTRENGSWIIGSTPLYPGDISLTSKLDSVFILKKGTENRVGLLRGMAGYIGLLEHTVQHQYDERMISLLLETLGSLVSEIPVYELTFRNDPEVIKYILENTAK